MKHIKLFESFGEGPAQLLVSGDWTGITKDGSPETFIAPATFICKFLPAGSPIPSGYEDQANDPTSDLAFIEEEAFGGDQNGVNVAPKDFEGMDNDTSQLANDIRQGTRRIFIDPSLNPQMIESHLRDACNRTWSKASDEEYYMVSEIEPDNFTPDYLRAAEEDRPFPRKVIFE